MTIATEVNRIGGPIARGGVADLILPEYVMPSLMNTSIPTEADLVTQSEIQRYPLGTKLVKHNSIWRYARCGLTTARVGFAKVNASLVPGSGGNSQTIPGYEGAPYAAAAAGATAIKITDTVAAKNVYQGGLLTIYGDVTDANRYADYEIVGNDVSNATYTIIYIGEPGLKEALLITQGIDAYPSPYYNIQDKGVATGPYASVIGWAKMVITTGYFFWIQTAGRISGVTGASTFPGQTAQYRDVYSNTDGSLITYNAGYQRVGYLLHKTASNYGDNCFMLQLDQ